ncbi:unnamed protein product [Closterium sp. NIES-54]
MSTTHVSGGGIAPAYGYLKFTLDKVTVTPLQGQQDLITWKEAIEPQLEVTGLKGFADGIMSIPHEDEVELRGEFRAAHLLTFMVISSHQAWRFIMSTYQATEDLYIGQLEEQPTDLRMGEQESTMDYCNHKGYNPIRSHRPALSVALPCWLSRLPAGCRVALPCPSHRPALPALSRPAARAEPPCCPHRLAARRPATCAARLLPTLLRAALLASTLLPTLPCCTPPCCLCRPASARPAARSPAGRHPAARAPPCRQPHRPAGSRTAAHTALLALPCCCPPCCAPPCWPTPCCPRAALLAAAQLCLAHVPPCGTPPFPAIALPCPTWAPIFPSHAPPRPALRASLVLARHPACVLPCWSRATLLCPLWLLSLFSPSIMRAPLLPLPPQLTVRLAHSGLPVTLLLA